MPTATAVAKQKAVAVKEPKMISAEERTRIKQQREKLAQELAHCQENFDIAATALEAAADPDKDPEVYMVCHRDFTILRKKLAAKQAEIAEHRQKFLSDEEIAKRDREEQEEAEEAAREEARRKIAAPLAEELMEAVRCSLKADATYAKLQRMFAAGQTPFPNNHDVNELCKTAARNMRTNDPNYKILLEGGPGGSSAVLVQGT